MGTLAQIGIAHGRKVPALGLLDQLSDRVGSFSVRSLERMGFGDIARQVSNHKDLEVDQIGRLVAEASFPALLKLVELKGVVPASTMRPGPLAVLPLSLWLNRHGMRSARRMLLQFTRKVPHSCVQFVIDSLDLSLLNHGLLDLLKEVAATRRDIHLVGPTPREIFEWVTSQMPDLDRSAVYKRVEEIVDLFKEAGIYRLQACQSVAAVNLLHDRGFPNCLVTDITQFRSADQLAHALYKINKLSGPQHAIDVWVPGTGSPSIGNASPVFQDMRILRALAVGSICLNNVPYKRASSRRLSLEGINLARHCGANDLGFGAIDSTTSDMLKLQPLTILQQAVG